MSTKNNVVNALCPVDLSITSVENDQIVLNDDLIEEASKSSSSTSALVILMRHRWPSDLLDRVRNKNF